MFFCLNKLHKDAYVVTFIFKVNFDLCIDARECMKCSHVVPQKKQKTIRMYGREVAPSCPKFINRTEHALLLYTFFLLQCWRGPYASPPVLEGHLFSPPVLEGHLFFQKCYLYIKLVIVSQFNFNLSLSSKVLPCSYGCLLASEA